MVVAIHQPHYFPWIGYFDKMAKVDKFILLDEVQLQNSSFMFRNRLLAKCGTVKYITVPYHKKSFLTKKYSEIEINNQIDWQKRHLSFIRENYNKSPYLCDILDAIEKIFGNDYIWLCDVTVESVIAIKELLKVNTEIILQSSLEYDRKAVKGDLVLEICKSIGAKTYISGKGASVDYLNSIGFDKNCINVIFQEFRHPTYQQLHGNEFISGISALDMLLSCGIQQSRDIFWNSVNGE